VVFRRGQKGDSDRRDRVSEADAYGDLSEVKDEERKISLADVSRAAGPWDFNEVEDPKAGRVDLGALLVPAVEGMELRLEMADAEQVIAATVVARQSAVQLQAFAAPRSEGIWAEVRAEIALEISKQGGTVDEREGPFGVELRAQVPVQAPDGSRGVQLVRFIGVDGPRWFLRALFAGSAAADPGAAAPLEAVLREVVVVRGEQPMPPRDLLELKLPAEAQAALEEQARNQPGEQEGNRFTTAPNPFERGPEMTETR